MKKGLVLEGGAMRGMYTAGVIDVFLENDISVDGVVGVSAGAAFGCNYKSKQIGRTIRYNKKYCKDPRYVGIKSLITTGDLYNVDFCYKQIPQKLDVFDNKTFAENPVEFYVTATDVNTGNAVYHKCYDGLGNDLEWLRASASMPIVSRVVEVDGLKLLDGGIADSIPIEWFRSIGYEKNIIVLTQHKGYRKHKSSALPFIKLSLKKYPKVYEAMARRHEMYNKTLYKIEEMQKDGSVYVLQPSVNFHMKRIENDPEKLEELYQLGRKDALVHLDEIREFLK